MAAGPSSPTDHRRTRDQRTGTLPAMEEWSLVPLDGAQEAMAPAAALAPRAAPGIAGTGTAAATSAPSSAPSRASSPAAAAAAPSVGSGVPRAAGMPSRPSRGARDWPWTWLVLAGGVAVLAGLLAWKSVHDRARAAERAARLEADARAAHIAQAGQAQDTDARIDAIHGAWLRGQGAAELPAVRAMAQGGNARAMVLLGTMLSEAHGIPKDRPEAVRWLVQAADSGSALAAVRLGAMYERGGDGEPRQLSAAENWYLRAARQGDAAGLYSLGTLYARGGDTVVQRPITACMLMELAARAHAASGRDDVLLPAGHSALGARAAQMRLAGTLGTQDAAEATRRADAWKPGQPLDL